ncbi:hypothetical protein WN51_02833 [Melipona quadrifasciata]|uniref:Uncharacterized protein n=1 Tax=Melipona quadrifasciata TaxID=166423 RepID=A0A0M9A8T9_9HYME|nr:hypothetical protein WN51_02833 [Melipona quadrifasciata]
MGRENRDPRPLPTYFCPTAASIKLKAQNVVNMERQAIQQLKEQ